MNKCMAFLQYAFEYEFAGSSKTIKIITQTFINTQNISYLRGERLATIQKLAFVRPFVGMRTTMNR
jgi:hypothetical protein